MNKPIGILARLNITNETLKAYQPMSQISDNYLEKVILNSRVLTFDKGEVVFEKKHALPYTYYLLKGKIKAQKNLFSSTVLDAAEDECHYDINKHIPNGVKVTALESGHILMVDPKILDMALAWSDSGVISDTPPTAQVEKPAQKSSSAADEEEVDLNADTVDDVFDWMAHLLEFPLFYNLPPSSIQQVFACFEQVDVNAGDVVISQGDEGDKFYVIVQGEAEVIKEGVGKVAELSAGNYFGEDALVSDVPRSATVRMLTEGLLSTLDKEDFKRLLKDSIVEYITSAEAEEKIRNDKSYILLDIRSSEEYDHAHSDQSQNIPLANLRAELGELDTEATYLISKEGGKRSDLAAHLLKQSNINAYVIRDQDS